MNKLGVASTAITLPQGGGALRGIGETFTAHPQTGAGAASIPLSLPAGRRGWDRRCGLRTAPAAGRAPSDSAGRSMSRAWRARRSAACRATTTTTCSSFRARRTSCRWAKTVPTRIYLPAEDGGALRPDRLPAFSLAGDRPGRGKLRSTYDVPLADPDAPARVFAWRMGETRNLLGDRVMYEWERDSGDTGEHRWEQRYLRRVRWMDYPDDAGARRSSTGRGSSSSIALTRSRAIAPASRFGLASAAPGSTSCSTMDRTR